MPPTQFPPSPQYPPAPSNTGNSNSPVSWMDKLFGYSRDGTDFGGIATPIMQGVGGLANSWTAFKQLGLAEDQLNFQRDAFNINGNQQFNNMRGQLIDRFQAMDAANPGGYGTQAEMLARYGLTNSPFAGGNTPAQSSPQQRLQANSAPQMGGGGYRPVPQSQNNNGGI